MVRLSWAAMVGLVVLALGGCSVIVRGETGVAVEDGRVFAVVRTCAVDYTVHSLELTPARGEWFFLPRPTWEFEDTSDARIDLGTVDEFVALIDGREMMISAQTNGSAVGSVYLDEDLIAALNAGDIAARVDRKTSILTSSEFDELVAAHCR